MYLIIFLLLIITINVIKPNLFETFETFIPVFNIPTRNTRGMSYDLRCTPRIPKRHVPWMYGTMYPNHYGKCLEML